MESAIALTPACEFATDRFNYRQRNGGDFYRRTTIPLASGNVGDTTTRPNVWLATCNERGCAGFTSALSAFCAAGPAEFKMEAVAFRGKRETHYPPHAGRNTHCQSHSGGESRGNAISSSPDV